ncbi:hypothetical protein A2U01_0064718, partial [Trifolium medium]|nr:hypothetical protein [Trifolium medium]
MRTNQNKNTETKLRCDVAATTARKMTTCNNGDQ